MNDFLHLLYSDKLNEYQETILNNQIKELAGHDEMIQVGDNYFKIVPNPIGGSYMIVILDKYGRIIDEIIYDEV